MKSKFHLILAVAALLTGIGEKAAACSRILYVGDDDLRIVGRSLDWKTPIPTNIYVYPRGIEKHSHSLPGAKEWKARYGSVYAVSYDGGVTEGMNEKGLVVNGLFCKGTVYENDSTSGNAPMSLAMFPAWILDLAADTPEAIDMIRRHDYTIAGSTFDGGTVTALHWGITDAKGRCAVIEFDHGKINIYEGTDMPAMTHDPTYPAMTAIGDYWEKIGGTHMLPGTVSSPDRYVRGVFFDKHVEKTADAALGFSIIRSILVNVSVPYTYTVGEGNVSSTQWRSFSNIRDLRYYFDIVTNPGAFYIDLKECDLTEGSPVMKLDTSVSTDYVGNVTGRLVRTAPFTPMY